MGLMTEERKLTLSSPSLGPSRTQVELYIASKDETLG